MRSLLLLSLVLVATSCQAQGDQVKSSEVKMIRDNEPGKAFTLNISVLDLDTRKPVKGAEIFAYQTNHVGDYENGADGIARIHGTAWSDSNGNVRLVTIYPRGYNNSNTGEHIHFRVKSKGYSGGTADLMFSDFYNKRYDINNPVVTTVYLKDLQEQDGRMTGNALLFMKKL